jgi:hypothetical protein
MEGSKKHDLNCKNQKVIDSNDKSENVHHPTFLLDKQHYINGSFAVTSDRKRLSCKTTDDKNSFDSEWNEALMCDAVCNAYILFLENLRLAILLLLSVPEAHVMNQDVVDDLPEVLKFDKLLPTSI